jgi:hypothetical protein
LNKKFSIKNRENEAIITVSGEQSFTNIYDKNNTLIFSDKSSTREINAILDKGDYTIESDGKIKSIKTTFFDMGEPKDE